MDAAVPAIEVADDADAAGAGSPDGEVNAADTFEGNEMSAEFFISVVMAALAHEMQVKLSEDTGKSVGVVNFERLAVVRAPADLVACWRGRIRLAGGPEGFEETFGAELRGVRDFGRRK